MTAGMRGAFDAPRSWSSRQVALLVAGLAAAALVRILLVPVPGLAGNLDEFAGWVHRLATGSLGRVYEPGDVTFMPVMVYVWAAIAALVPAFRAATELADPAFVVTDPQMLGAMKLAPALADLGLALGVAYALRARPAWAVAGALAVALHPAVIDVSMLFGQYESIYTLFGLLAFLLAVGGRPSLAAVALALALMTKPQAAVFVVPFAAWSIARDGWLATARLVAIAVGVAVLVWLPFIPFGGPGDYLRSLATHQNDLFGVLSLRAWNPWWMLQSAAAGDSFLSDADPLLGPLAPRQIGLILAALLELYVFALVLRRPTRDGLAWGLAASSMAAFVALTTMHERYAFPALVFLAVLFPDRRAIALFVAFGVAFTANLLAAVPPNDAIAAILPIGGAVGLVGSFAMVAVAAGALIGLRTVGEDLRGSDQELARPLPSLP